MDQPYKTGIANLIEGSCWNAFFSKPSSGAREYPLKMPPRTCYADFCYDFGTAGKLFIEDDDAERGLNNLVKYWRWCLLNPGQQPVHLIHIIGADNGVCLDHCLFIKERMEKELESNCFKYHILTINKQWHAFEGWLPKLKEILTRINLTH